MPVNRWPYAKVDDFLHRRWFDVTNIQYKDGNYIFILKTKVNSQQELLEAKKSSKTLSIISSLFSSICISSMTIGGHLGFRTQSSFYFIKYLF